MTTIAWNWWWPEINSCLSVSRSVASVFDQHRQCLWRSERGGQLFVDLSNPNGLIMTLATPPHPKDRAGRIWLELDGERCQREIESANAKGLRLVGYWHTHPQTIPAISPTDMTSFSKFARQYSNELPHPIAVIVGQSTEPNGIKAWSFRNGTCLEATISSANHS
ncbi:Mov34/MPN/PAD-1 family protein [Pseudomonas auratipiscis]|uniref:Mov34/MPN/PAD-1 family protein n=1 Tax=Pseudomonas auratipiscis TaxID=3115853 RepID=A0AB35WQZ3_9PSED|nr:MULTISPECIES: Mov34/MPN/PAD-1 family protein [unclassified Pseudomonas]MEE1867008.1 Mov34/MPN/PAD-1 family protein [Pseudomonas sp. 120P]MEE1957835.1 Mov34/MPN/PAD-1 family protein [Pseudomonas sp. 119P]